MYINYMINTVFFNTSNRMLPLLKKLCKTSNVMLSIVKKDVKIGKNKSLEKNVIKKYCDKNKIKCIQIENLKDQNVSLIINELNKITFDVAIVVDFGFIIPKILLQKYENKFFNIHYSLLPKYRGASPIQFAILNNDKNTGITYQKVHYQMDLGNIIQQNVLKINRKYTSESLFKKLQELNINTLSDFLNKIKTQNYSEIKQNNELASYTSSTTDPKKTTIHKEDAYIDFTDDCLKIECKIRAFIPWPISWTTIQDICKYYDLKIKDKKNLPLKVKIFDGHIKNNNIILDIIQIEGKNKTDFKSFINGYCEK